MKTFIRGMLAAFVCTTAFSALSIGAQAHEPHPNLADEARMERAYPNSPVPGGPNRVDCGDALDTHRTGDLAHATCPDSSKASAADRAAAQDDADMLSMRTHK